MPIDQRRKYVHFPLQQNARELTSSRTVLTDTCSSSSDSFDLLHLPTRAMTLALSDGLASVARTVDDVCASMHSLRHSNERMNTHFSPASCLMGRGISKEFIPALLLSIGHCIATLLIFDKTKSREHSRIDAADDAPAPYSVKVSISIFLASRVAFFRCRFGCCCSLKPLDISF